MTLILTGSPTRYGEDRFTEDNGFLATVKAELPERPRLLMVSAAPDDRAFTDSVLEGMTTCITNSGIRTQWTVMLDRRNAAQAKALVESAAGELDTLAGFGFTRVALSVKASDVPTAVEAYRLASERFSCPLHVGVTEAGTSRRGVVNSSVGIGTLLMEGIGDTIRVSLTADPEEEVRAGLAILRACGLRRGGVRFVSCPTCGRTSIDLIGLARTVEESLAGLDRDITVAVMGCEVNGPGEASHADYGIAGGKGFGSLFMKGRVVKTRIPEAELSDALCRLIESEARE